jgi:triphosphatase
MGGGTALPDETEIEWQYDAIDLRPVERWLAALPSRNHAGAPTLTALAKPPRRLVDHYVDTEDWRIGQAGLVMRTRQRGRAVEVTMKDVRPAAASGLRQRLELTESLPGGDLKELGSSGPVGRRVSALTGRRPLVQVLEVRTRRLPFSLRAGGVEVAEVALDDTILVVGGGQRPARLRRVEVEVVPDWVERLAPVVADLRAATGLQPATLSKFEAGLLAAGLAVPGPPELGPMEVGPGSTLGEVAFAVIRRQLRELLAHEPGTRLGEDIEELHDMRVATRRLRAAFDLFVDAMPARAPALREELRWLADALGAVRDLDVQLDRMTEMAQWAEGWPGAEDGSALAHLRALLEEQRADARQRLLGALDSPRWERLAGALVTLARQGPLRRTPEAWVPAAVAVPPLVEKRHRAVTKAARKAHRSGIASDFHRLRIRCKRLRYSLEFTAGIYGQPVQRFVKKLAGLQDELGRMQDAETAMTRLSSLAIPDATPRSGANRDATDRATADVAHGAGLPPSTVFMMGGVAEHYRHESRDLRASMGHRLGVLDGKSWDGASAAMSRLRDRALAQAAAAHHVQSSGRGDFTRVRSEGADRHPADSNGRVPAGAPCAPSAEEMAAPEGARQLEVAPEADRTPEAAVTQRPP